MALFPTSSPSPSSRGTLYVLSGPGGVGKTTIGSEVANRNDNVWREISVTTRKPRPGEVPGFDYYFVSEADFRAKFRNGELLEYAQVHGSWYGTLRHPVEEKLSQGVHVLLIIDVDGGLTVQQNYETAVLIFLRPPDLATLRQRMEERNIDTDMAIETRLRAAHQEIRIGMSYYDHVVVSGDLETAISEVEQIIV